MSVRACDRNESKVQYLNTAIDLFEKSLPYLVRISKRYSSLLAPMVVNGLQELISHCEKANTCFPSSKERKEQRIYHLIEALGILNSLDVQFSIIHRIMLSNLLDVFNTETSKKIEESEAAQKVGRQAKVIGELINMERALLTATIKAAKAVKISDELNIDNEIS